MSSSKKQELLLSCRSSIRGLYEALRDGREATWLGAEQTMKALTELDGSEAQNYLELLERWSRTQRLTGWRTSSERLRLGLMPSWAGAALIAPTETWVDLGSGAGLPGMAFAMLRTGRSGYLVEARRKRVSFLNEARRKLGSKHIEIKHGRIEAGSQLPEPFDKAVLLARAFAKPRRLLELADTLERPAVVAWLGEADSDSFSDGAPAPWTLSAKIEGEVYGAPGAILRFDRR